MFKVLVSGASGFVGSRLVKFLILNGVQVTAIVRDPTSQKRLNSLNIETVVCEMGSYSNLHKIISKRGFDVFYHLAWSGSSGPLRSSHLVQMENVKNTCDAVLAAKHLECKKLVVTGTITENITCGIVDRADVTGNEFYAIAKSATHAAVDVLCKLNRIPYVWAQLSNVYGGENTTQNLVSYALTELQSGRQPEFTKADQPYDFIYINDAIRALYLLGISMTPSSKYFVGSGEPRILRDYINIILDKFDTSLRSGIGLKKDGGFNYEWAWFDTSRLKNDTGFAVENTFENYIEHLINGSCKSIKLKTLEKK